MDDRLKEFDEKTKKNIQNWLKGDYDTETKQAIEDLINNDPKELQNGFFQKLSFGTGGARGIMGVGTNRLNKYTIQFAAQGLANFLNSEKTKTPKVIIGYDNRNHSKEFGEETAKVLAANGIHVYLFNELRPTPLVSFGCREKQCQAAVMITASHNPPSYNGFKVYGPDGGQVLAPYDKMIIDEVNKIEDPSQVQITTMDSKLIEIITDELDKTYLATIEKLQLLTEGMNQQKSALKLVYTNLHGAGITLIPKALEKWGFNTPFLVEEQMTIDGNFSYAKKPNPEEKEALSLGIDLMRKTQADLLLASDPDADRMGVVVKHEGKEIILTGNQIASILLFHIASHLAEKKLLQPGSAVIKSIVTTELMKEIASSFDISCFDVLTGFKYIGEKMTEWQEDHHFSFIFGAEESLGFLYGTHARDKDAVIAACLIAEVGAQAKAEEKTLIDVLHSIYKHYGIYREALVSIGFEEGETGMQKMSSVMQSLRDTSPMKIGNYTVKIIEDYLSSESNNLEDKSSSILSLPKSNVLTFIFDDDSKLVIRPSGTEPKIKIYAQTHMKDFSSIEEGISLCDERLKAMISSLEAEINSLS